MVIGEKLKEIRLRKQEIMLRLKRRAAPSPQESELQRLRSELKQLKRSVQQNQQQPQPGPSTRQPSARVPPRNLVVMDDDSDVEP